MSVNIFSYFKTKTKKLETLAKVTGDEGVTPYDLGKNPMGKGKGKGKGKGGKRRGKTRLNEEENKKLNE